MRSAMNAISHGLFARAVVLAGEDKDAFQALLSDLVTVLRPANTLELTLVEEMAASTWRQRRCMVVEHRLVDLAASRNGPPTLSSIATAYAELAEGPAVNLMHRYEARVHRMYQRAFQNLLVFRQYVEVQNEPSPTSEHGLPQDEPQDEDPIALPEPEPDPEPEPEPATVPTPVPEPPVLDRTTPAPSPLSVPHPDQPPAPTPPWTTPIPAFSIP
jgi:hypothetical protein